MQRRPLPSFLSGPGFTEKAPVYAHLPNVDESTTVRHLEDNLWKTELYVTFKSFLNVTESLLPFVVLLLVIGAYYLALAKDNDSEALKTVLIATMVTILAWIFVAYLDKYI